MAKNNKKTTSKSKRIPVLIAAGAAAVLLVVTLLWVFSGKPVDKLKKAAAKTLFAENFTITFEMDINGDPCEGVMNAAIDPDQKKLDMYMQLTTRASDYICGIYNNTFVVAGANTKTKITDITDRVSAFFETLKKNGDPDWSALLELDSIDLYGTITQSFDLDKLLTCLGQWLNTMNDTSWAEDFAGYSKEREKGVTVHHFSPDPYVLVCQSLPMFEAAFLDPADYTDLQTYIENAKYLLKDGSADFSFGIQGGRLVSAEFDLEYHNTAISGSGSFIGIGSTIVDSATIAYYIEEEKQ